MRKYILLAVLFIVATALIFLSPWVFKKEVTESILPWTNLALAVVAVLAVFITIDLNRRLAVEQKEYELKRRNLETIENWANLVYEATNKIEVKEEIRAELIEEFIKLEHIRIKSFEVFKLKNLFDKVEDFPNNVETTANSFMEYTTALLDAKSDAKSDVEKITDESKSVLKKHMFAAHNSVNKLLLNVPQVRTKYNL